jgi:hypothetical protein
LSIEKRLSRGFQFQSSYTFSKVLDTTQGQKGGEGGGGGTSGDDPDNKIVDKGPSDFNTPHSWTFNTLYNLPGPQMNGVGGAILRGWRLGGILTLRSGLPFSVSLSGNHSRSRNLGGDADRPDLAPGRTPDDIILGGPDKYFDPTAFQIQPLGYLGNAGRNFLYGPGQANLDFSIAKDFPFAYLGEGGRFEFRTEVFNLLNRANFFIPEARTVYTATETSPPDTNRTAAQETPLSTAGQISRTRGTARQIQFALRMTF